MASQLAYTEIDWVSGNDENKGNNNKAPGKQRNNHIKGKHRNKTMKNNRKHINRQPTAALQPPPDSEIETDNEDDLPYDYLKNTNFNSGELYRSDAEAPSVAKSLAKYQLPPPPAITKAPKPVKDAFSLHRGADDSDDDGDGGIMPSSALKTTQYSGVNDNMINQYSQYFKKHVPNFKSMSQSMGVDGNHKKLNREGQDKLMEKLNYITHLLEEQQDEATNNVTEELILYMFLGVFVIFVVDSFAQSGKYVR